MVSLIPIARRFAEVLSRRIILRRRLPKQFGSLPIYVSPGCGLRYWGNPSKFDEMLYRMAGEMVGQGGIVWDVGANVGLFTLCAAARSGLNGFTLAIEPDPWLCGIIGKTVRANQGVIGKIMVENVAVGAVLGTGYLEVSVRSRALNRVGQTDAGGIAVRSVTLDSLLQFHPAPTVLKIDVEAGELDVLRGASKILKNHRPAIWCEVDHENATDVSNLLHGVGYDLFSPVTEKQISKANWHTVAIHRQSKDSSQMNAGFAD